MMLIYILASSPAIGLLDRNTLGFRKWRISIGSGRMILLDYLLPPIAYVKKSAAKVKGSIEDFIDLQEHRLDPGYWTTEVYGKGRRFPISKDVLRQHLSSFQRALMIFVLLCPIVIGLFLKFGNQLQHLWFWGSISLVGLFLGLWLFMHRSMIRNGCIPTARGDKIDRT